MRTTPCQPLTPKGGGGVRCRMRKRQGGQGCAAASVGSSREPADSAEARRSRRSRPPDVAGDGRQHRPCARQGPSANVRLCRESCMSNRRTSAVTVLVTSVPHGSVSMEGRPPPAAAPGAHRRQGSVLPRVARCRDSSTDGGNAAPIRSWPVLGSTADVLACARECVLQQPVRLQARASEWPLADPRSGWAAPREAGYRLGSDRGSPNQGRTLLSKRVMAQIWSPVRVST